MKLDTWLQGPCPFQMGSSAPPKQPKASDIPKPIASTFSRLLPGLSKAAGKPCSFYPALYQDLRAIHEHLVVLGNLGGSPF